MISPKNPAYEIPVIAILQIRDTSNTWDIMASAIDMLDLLGIVVMMHGAIDAFTALTMSVGQQKGIQSVQK